MSTDGILNPTLLVPVAAGAVVLLGIGIAVFQLRAARKKREALDRWANAAYALWTGGEDCATWPAERAQNALRDWYGAKAGPGFWQVIRGLRQGQTGNPAWDKVRALDLLRIGLAATYIDVEQARNEAASIGGELQRQYGGWDDLARAFEAGMLAWQASRGVTDPEQRGRVQRSLPKLRQHTWPAIRFDTPLVAGD